MELMRSRDIIKLESDWSSLLNDVNPQAGNFVADQIAAIVEGRIKGSYPKMLMRNLIKKHKEGILHDTTPPDISEENMSEECENLLSSINPCYSILEAREVAEILEMESKGVNVNSLFLNMISRHRDDDNSQGNINIIQSDLEIVEVLSDSDE